jgi:hypothetical protein
MNLFKFGGSRRKSRSRKNRKSRRRRSLRGGEGAGARAGVMGMPASNNSVASRR